MKGEIFALLASFLWAFTAIFFTKASRILGVLKINIGRLFLGNIYLFFTLIFLNKGFSLSYEQFFYLSLSGIIGLALGDWFLFESFLLLGSQLTMLIFTSSPIITILLSYIFLKEKLNLLNFIGVFFILLGIVLALIKKGEKKFVFKGVMFAFLGGLMQSIGLVLAKKALNTGIDTLLATFYRMLPAFFSLLIILSFIKFKDREQERDKKFYGFLFMFLGSLVGPYLGVWFSQIAIKYASTGISATLLSLSPIFLIPLNCLFEKEKISNLRIIGTFISIFGVYILLK